MVFQAPQNLSEQIAEHISGKIIRWELKPGERIREESIARELGVSRSPIRESMRILEKQRLVELIPRKGARVTEISPSHVDWLFDILGELLGLVGRRCAKNACNSDLQRINAAMGNVMESAVKGDSTAYYSAIVEYALACLAAAANPLLEQMIFDLLPITRRILFASFSVRKDRLLENAQMVQEGTGYIETRNGEMASRTVQRWLQIEKEFSLKALQAAMDTGAAAV